MLSYYEYHIIRKDPAVFFCTGIKNSYKFNVRPTNTLTQGTPLAFVQLSPQDIGTPAQVASRVVLEPVPYLHEQVRCHRVPN